MQSSEERSVNGLRVTRRLCLGAVTGTAMSAVMVACAPQPRGAPGTGQQPAETGAPVRGGTLTVASFADAKTMQPLLSSDTASSAYIERHYNAPLLRRDPETLALDTKYGTAESFQISPDGLTLTFKLKSNIFWSDGRPITAADYKFTWDKMMDPKVEYPYRSLFNNFESLDAPDDRTLIYRLKEPFCPAIDYANLNPIPKHVFENLDINDNPLNQKPAVGSGPWLLQEWVKDSHAVFVANERFYLGRPYLDRVVTRIVADQTVEFSMLKAGEVDQAGLRAEDWDEARRLSHVNTINYYPASASWTYIGFNLRNEILKDLRVRQALAHAIDRQTLIQRIRLGHARPINSIFAAASWAYTDDVPKVTYDPEKAKRLLDEAGWRVPPGNPTGTRMKDGRPLKMRIFYNAGNKEREQIATIAQQYAKAIGVELEVISEEWNAYLERVTRRYDMELFVLGWSSGLEPHGSLNLWTTGKAQNYTGYSNPQVDELFPKAATVPGCKQEDRQKIYAEIQRIIAPDLPYIFLWENESLSALHNRIVPNKLTRLGYGYRMWEWYSKTGK